MLSPDICSARTGISTGNYCLVNYLYSYITTYITTCHLLSTHGHGAVLEACHEAFYDAWAHSACHRFS